METKISFKDMNQNVFAEDANIFTRAHTYKFDSVSVPLNTIAGSVPDDDTTANAVSYSERLKKYKSTEVNISKSILYSIYYKSKIDIAYPYLHDDTVKFKSFNYTNLNNFKVPNLETLDFKLNSTLALLNKFGNFAASDKATQLFNSLQSEIDEYNKELDGIYTLILGEDATADCFIRRAYALFRGGDKLEQVTLSGAKLTNRVTEIKNTYLEYAGSVKAYMDGIDSVLKDFKALESKLNSNYKCTDEQLSNQIAYRKQDLLATIYKYTEKYLASANIVYSIKSDAIEEYFHPEEDIDNKVVDITVNESTDFGDIDTFEEFFNENAEDMLLTGLDKKYQFTNKLMLLESEYAGYRINTAIHEGVGKDIADFIKSIWKQITDFFDAFTDETSKDVENRANALFASLGDANHQQALKNSLTDRDSQNYGKTFNARIPLENLQPAMMKIRNCKPKGLGENEAKAITNPNETTGKQSIFKLVDPTGYQDIINNGYTFPDDDKDSKNFKIFVKYRLAGFNINLQEALKKDEDLNGQNQQGQNTASTGFAMKNITSTELGANWDKMMDVLNNLHNDVANAAKAFNTAISNSSTVANTITATLKQQQQQNPNGNNENPTQSKGKGDTSAAAAGPNKGKSDINPRPGESPADTLNRLGKKNQKDTIETEGKPNEGGEGEQ